MAKFLIRFLRDESGATAIEYGIIASLISIAILGVVTLIGSSLDDTFHRASDALTH